MATVLITGANRGIGLALTRAYKERGDDVIACCRKPSDALTATGARVERLDVTSDDEVAALASRLGDVQLDVLVNNAGILRGGGLDQLDLDSVRSQFEVNAVGPLRVTHGLRGHLAPGAKVGIVTSRMGSIADNTSGGAYGYRMSKAAVNAAGRSLALDLGPSGVSVALLHPGWVRTDMTGGRGNWEAEDAAAGIVSRLEALDIDSSGTFWHDNGEPLPW